MNKQRSSFAGWKRWHLVRQSGVYWHWSGHAEFTPMPVFVLQSGHSPNHSFFASRGQLGFERAMQLEELGGWWKKINEPSSYELKRMFDNAGFETQ